MRWKHDTLDLKMIVEAFKAKFAPDAALADSAPRRRRVEPEMIVDPFFPEHLVLDKNAVASFVETHQRLMQPASALESSSLLQHLILLLLRRFAGKRPEMPALKEAPRAVRIARAYIEDRLSANPSLDDLSAVAGMSPFHLSRLFKRSMGLPPHAYQNHLRVQKAKALLADGQPSDEVAAEVGFADQSHFIRQFKRQVGMTPHVYRESIRR